MTSPPSTVTYRELFSHREYLYLWIGQVVSFSGDALTRVALPIYVFQLTGSPAALGGTFALQQLPWILFGPVVGVLIDRVNRKKLLISSVLLESLAIALILLANSLWQIYFLAFSASTIQVVISNTRQAAIPDVIGKRLYSRAVAVSIMSIQAIDTAGVALAGALIAITGPKVAMSIDVLTFTVNAGLIALVHIPQPKQSVSQKLTIWHDMKTGFRFIRASAPLKVVIGMMILRGLTMIGIIPLFVDFVQTDLNAGPFEFGLMSAVASLGYVLASFLTVKLDKRITPFQMLVWGSALSGLFLIPFLMVRIFTALLLLRFISALMYGSGNLVANVQIVNLAPSEVRGRVSSTSWSFIKLSQVISSTGLGFVASGYGTPFAIASTGLLLFSGSMLVLLITSRSVKNALTVATS